MWYMQSVLQEYNSGSSDNFSCYFEVLAKKSGHKDSIQYLWSISRPWKNLWFGFIYVTEVMPFIAVNYWTLYKTFPPGITDKNQMSAECIRSKVPRCPLLSYQEIYQTYSEILSDGVYKIIPSVCTCTQLLNTSSFQHMDLQTHYYVLAVDRKPFPDTAA